MVFLLACLILVIAGLIMWASKIPPFYATLLCGFLVGWLTTAVRYDRAFRRQWPLLDLLIDWKLANRLRQKAGTQNDHEL